MTTTFNVPGAIVIGAGASRQLGAQLQRLGVRKVLLVTDPFFAGSGLVERAIADIKEAGLSAVVFADVQPDPTDQNVREGRLAFATAGCDGIAALGGGSPIDAAKAIAILATNPEPLSQYQGLHKIPRPGVPLVAVPTTAGTGSEVTKVAVITDTGRDIKMMMLDPHLLPGAALVDYELTLSMPAALTAHVGVDTLTHGIEAYVSRKASALTDPLALTCIRLVAQHLETAWREPQNRAAREGMMLAATLGGMAFANSSVALVHGMSRPIGALFHVPHGLSNAMLLPAVTRFSLKGAEARYAAVARTMKLCGENASQAGAAQSLLSGLADLNTRLQVPRIRDLPGMKWDVFEPALPKMAADALASGSPANNPVVPNAEEIGALYREAW